MNATYLQSYQANGRPVTNPDLLRDMRAGSEDAWYQLYTGYQKWLLGIAGSMGVRREDAEDLVQKTLIALSTHISDFVYERTKGRFSGWLQKALRRKIYSFWGASSRNPLNSLPPTCHENISTDPLEWIASPLRDEVITQVLVHELQGTLQKGYEELKASVSTRQWSIFEAYNIQDLPVEEVALRFGLQPDSVYCIDSRMIHKLRQIVNSQLAADREDAIGSLTADTATSKIRLP